MLAKTSSIVRMSPAECLLTEQYSFRHKIEARQTIDVHSSSGILQLLYRYDGTDSADLVRLLKKQGADYPTLVQVGLWTVDKADRATPIILPTDDLASRMFRCDTCTTRFPIPASQLRSIPLRIDATILDESKQTTEDGYFESHDFSNRLYLSIRLSLHIPTEVLQRSHGVTKKLNQILSGDFGLRFVRTKQGEEEDASAIAPYLAALANSDGGVLICGYDEQLLPQGLQLGKLETIKRAIEAAALSLQPPLRIGVPLQVEVDGHQIILVEVVGRKQSLGASHRYFCGDKVYEPGNGGTAIAVDLSKAILRPAYESVFVGDVPESERLSTNEADREIRRGGHRRSMFVAAITSEVPSFQSALANAGGGRILYGVRPQSGGAGEVLGLSGAIDDLATQLKKAGHKHVPCSAPYVVKVFDKVLLVQEVPTDLPDLYRGAQGLCTYDGRTIRPLTDSEALATMRYRRSPVSGVFSPPEPILDDLSLEWIEFPEANDLYDPQTRTLQWKAIPLKPEQANPGVFSCELTTSITRSKELFARKVLHGSAHITLTDVSFGSSTVRFYDALGHQQDVDVVSKTEFTSDLSLSLRDILRRRPYYPWRSLTILGIEPRTERVRDIVRVLNDIGILVKDATPLSRGPLSIQGGVRVFGEKRGRRGLTTIRCDIHGSPIVVKRSLRRGERTDDKELKSGAMYLNFQVATDEEHPEVVALLNEVIENIDRRLRFSRVE